MLAAPNLYFIVIRKTANQFAVAFAFLFTLITTDNTYAQTNYAPVTAQQESVNQTQRESTQFRPGPGFRIVKPKNAPPPRGQSSNANISNTNDDQDSFAKRIRGSYFVSFSGPRLTGNAYDTYNVFLGDIGPAQYFHAAKLGAKITDQIEIGVSGSAVHNVAGPIVSPRTGFVYQRSFVFFDPSIYLNLPSPIQISGWTSNLSLGAAIPITEGSRDVNRVTSITIAQSFGVDLNPSKWSFGFSFYLNPQFYNGEVAAGLYRQTLNGNLGLNLGYRLSEIVAFQTSMTFDFDKRYPDPLGDGHFGPGLEDRGRLSVSITPNVFPYQLSFGTFLQYLLMQPSAETTTLGFDASVGF